MNPIPPPPEWPFFAWSHSRDRHLIDCARSYYWHYYGSWLGWKDGADPENRRAYTLKQLTTLPLVLGSILHELARECAVAIQLGRTPPPYDALLHRARDELNRVYLSSRHRELFLANPKNRPFLRDVFYSGQFNRENAARVREKMFQCLTNLSEWSIWTELATLPPNSIRLVDQLGTFVVDGVTVYGAPDLVYLPSPDHVVIGDWKTGGEEGVDLQLALYALYLTLNLGFKLNGSWQGRVMNLSTGLETWYDIRSEDLLDAVDRIRDSVGAMRSYLANAETNQPLGRAAFPVLAPGRRAKCANCSFLELCFGELEASTRGRGEG